jgi:hypothetical protein
MQLMLGQSLITRPTGILLHALAISGIVGTVLGCSTEAAATNDDSGTPMVDAAVEVGPSADAMPMVSDAGTSREASASNVDADANNTPVLDPRDRPGIFVAVGDHVRHTRSVDDGLTWIDDATEYPPSMMGDLYGIRNVIWADKTFVAFAAKLLVSTDGNKWTDVPKDGQWLASMLYADGSYVASGGYGFLATSAGDLGKWTQHPPRADYTVAHHSRSALAYGKVAGRSAYVVVNDDGEIFYSADAKAWMPSNAPRVAAGNSWGTQFTYGNGMFIGLRPDGISSIRSTDGGSTWTTNPALPQSVQSVVYAQGHFTGLGTGHVLTSVDGVAWMDRVEPSALRSDLTYGHGTYLALENGKIYRSSDGVTFKKVLDNAGKSDAIGALAFGPR